MTVSRVVTLLTPVFSGLAGYLCVLGARYLPGAPRLDPTELTAVFIAGGTFAFGQAANWLRNRSKHELLTAANSHMTDQRAGATINGLHHQIDQLDRRLAHLEEKPKPKPRQPKRVVGRKLVEADE